MMFKSRESEMVKAAEPLGFNNGHNSTLQNKTDKQESK